MAKKILISLLLTLVLSFVLRFYLVAKIPPSLNWDEASIGYNAYSILKTGRDEWGEFLPLHFRSYGEYKLPVQIYASIPGIFTFGLNELGVRITPVIYGTLTVLFTFFLGRALFSSAAIGLISAFLLAISPWYIHLTRASFESSFSLLWVVLGIWLLVKGFKNGNWFVFSTLSFAVAIYTYNSARAFVPVFLIMTVFIYKDQLLRMKKYTLAAALVFLILLLPLLPFFLGGEGGARYKLVSITDDPGLTPRINENRGNSTLPKPLPRILHNKVTYISYYIGRNYLSHFTPSFLFLTGAPHKQHHVQNMGQLYLFQAPFFILGLYFLFKQKHFSRGILLTWMIITYIPVSVTNDSIPHALRTLIGAPVYQIISAFGAVSIWPILKKTTKLVKVFTAFTLITIILFSLAHYLYNYYQIYPKLYSRDWQYGYKQVVEYIKNNQDKYDEIVFTRHYGEPHMFTLFYLQYDPYKYQTDPSMVRFETYDWVRVLKFDKYYFPDLGDAGTKYKDIISLPDIKNHKKRLLFIGKPGDFPEEAKKVMQVNFLDGKEAFELVEYK